MDRRDGSHESSARGLGGRIPLISPDTFDGSQRALYDRLLATRLRRAGGAGYTAALPDGRLIGPFNAMLRTPRLAQPLLEWAEAISRAGIPVDVREVVILTVAAEWQADYVRYAHTAAAERAGVPEAAVTALRQGETPGGLRPEAHLAHRITAALIREHHLPDDLYRQAVATFGEEGLVVLVNLIGQYQNTCTLLACFQVPDPTRTAAA